ncbi:hypothetical protein BJ508DRAFT_416996 [Ascobolus immersus RN42]|uniref:Uncharacterized protein n=1 Tax=Ascobolus immersus RN42 TaxID=1160509 RepID=A0A3N4HWT1_ASCIM|nr:hypothetical protein BJ508DRAFT_416996 [Ascobolus immersus RN42]
MSMRGAQSPPPEEQSDKQIGQTGSGHIEGASGGAPTENQNAGAKGAQTLKDSKSQGGDSQAGENTGTANLESNPKGALKDYSDNIRKKPGEWKAPGGDVDA